MKTKTVCLLSGGLDSATVLGMAVERGDRVEAISFDYQQRHSRELESARELAAHYLVPWQKITMPRMGGSALTGDSAIPLDGENSGGIPTTYVPGRNLLFLAFAVGFAEARGFDRVVTGVNALDYSGYPDCRPEFIKEMNAAVRVGTRGGDQGHPVCVVAPIVYLTKAEIIETGTAIGVPYQLTWSCYVGGEHPCSRCDSCRIRASGFAACGIPDPALSVSPTP